MRERERPSIESVVEKLQGKAERLSSRSGDISIEAANYIYCLLGWFYNNPNPDLIDELQKVIKISGPNLENRGKPRGGRRPGALKAKEEFEIKTEEINFDGAQVYALALVLKHAPLSVPGIVIGDSLPLIDEILSGNNGHVPPQRLDVPRVGGSLYDKLAGFFDYPGVFRPKDDEASILLRPLQVLEPSGRKGFLLFLRNKGYLALTMSSLARP